ncbi:hypothetical protein BBG47_07655 [Paenibacillus sp. KS1]|uniref:DUF2164 domain-containing protein n=1 Tax=Paenibacillus sp. KS1 TaxID=1849249 RepID=UPI00080664AE|nr:DUF2164 domain-containing protein [Paenibacillus sp. KS1]OBY80141.1 hypothetical protein BBG47_07655 [Paenibacillus sp. KS1]
MNVKKLPREQKEKWIEDLKQYFETERGESLGMFEAEELVDYLLKMFEPYLYNQAIEDARAMLEQRMAGIEEDLYAMKKSEKDSR